MCAAIIKRLLIILLCSLTSVICAQSQSTLDSLVASLRKAQQDSIKARLYVELSQHYQHVNPIKTAEYAQEAIQSYKQALLADTKLNQLGSVCHNMGTMYIFLKEEATALHHFEQALRQFQAEGSQLGEAMVWASMAEAYQKIGDLPKALAAAQKSLGIADETRKQKLIAAAYKCLGNVLMKQGKQSEAYTALRQALRLYEAVNKDFEAVDIMNALSVLKQGNQDWEKALEFASTAQAKAQKIGYLVGVMEAYQNLAKIYGTQGDFQKAYLQQEKYLMLKDSVSNQKELKRIATQQATYADHQKIAAYHQLKEQQLTQEKALNKASNKQFYLMISLVLSVTAVLLLGFNQRKQKGLVQVLQQQNSQTSQQKEILEKQNQDLQARQSQIQDQHHSTEHRNLELVHVNHDLADKNQRITDNITYAKRVQHAVLPMRYTLKKHFTDVSLIYLPKDIVSGDFYWLSTTEQYTYFALADGTGHGVSGAFMSLLGSSFLDEIVNARNILAPQDVLNQLHDKFIQKFQQGPELERDGLELAFCRFEEVGNNEVKMIFSGARENVYYCLPDQAEVHVLEGARKGIGGRFQRGNHLFGQEEVILPKETLVYFFTDGLPDHPKPNGRRLGTRNVLRFIQRHALLDIHTQTEIIKTILERYKQKIKQRDDISFIILKL